MDDWYEESDQWPSPGMYLVGRRDGGACPFFAQIEHNGEVLTSSRCCMQALQDRRDRGGIWWWRLIPLPVYLPDQRILAALPPLPMTRGGI